MIKHLSKRAGHSRSPCLLPIYCIQTLVHEQPDPPPRFRDTPSRYSSLFEAALARARAGGEFAEGPEMLGLVADAEAFDLF